MCCEVTEDVSSLICIPYIWNPRDNSLKLRLEFNTSLEYKVAGLNGFMSSSCYAYFFFLPFIYLTSVGRSITLRCMRESFFMKHL